MDETQNARVTCEQCERDLGPDWKDGMACPECGGSQSRIFLTFHEQVDVHDITHLCFREEGKRRPVAEWIIGQEYWRHGGKWVDKTRVIDREANRYMERVVDPTTGQVIHERDEPLDKHQGHGGSASRIVR